jgi:hypothetical protein
MTQAQTMSTSSSTNTMQPRAARNRQELLRAVQACQIPEEAHGLVKNEIAGLLAATPGLTPAMAREQVLENIGYATTALGRTEAGRILTLFDTKHPFLGAVESWPLTPEAIFTAGWEAGCRSIESAGGKPRDGNGPHPQL